MKNKINRTRPKRQHRVLFVRQLTELVKPAWKSSSVRRLLSKCTVNKEYLSQDQHNSRTGPQLSSLYPVWLT